MSQRCDCACVSGASNAYLELFRWAAAHTPLSPRAPARAVEARCHLRSALCSYFAWSVPTQAALECLAARAPLLECGAGTGYWASLLSASPYGADVLAVDHPDSQAGQAFRFRHPAVRSGCGVAYAGGAEAAGRALLLCWPDEVGDDAPGDADRGDFGAACVRAYRGRTVCHIGELGPAVTRTRPGFGDAFPPRGSSSSAALQRLLSEGFTLMETVALPNWPPYNAHLTVWTRNDAPATDQKQHSSKVSAAPAPGDVPANADPPIDAAWLLAPQDVEEFTRSDLHAAPLLLRATAARKALAPHIFSLDALLSRANCDDSAGALRFDVDVCASRVAKGARENPPLASGQPAGSQQLRALFAAGHTLQAHQPQRFSRPLWRLCASLERALGCLVGANAYLTPRASQGLMAHYDDVDVFVLHCCGTKTWRLYGRLEGPLTQRPRTHSADLPAEQLGPVTMEVTLQPGDVLYLPRGTPHQAVATRECSSSGGAVHVTLSSFQRWDAGDLAGHALRWLTDSAQTEGCPAAVAAAAAAAQSLRAPLPCRAVFAGEGARGAPSLCQLAQLTSAALRAAADALEAHPEALLGAIDTLSEDFMACRLPPVEADADTQGADRAPALSDLLNPAQHAYTARVRTARPGGASIEIVSCAGNDRHTHMMGGASGDSSSSDEEEEDGSVGGEEEEEEEEESEDEDGLVLAPDYAAAVRAVLTAAPPGVRVRDLPLASDAQKVELAGVLVAEGLANAKRK